MTVFLTHLLYVDTLVARGREPIVDPQERAYLATFEGRLQHLEAVGMQAHNLTRTKVAHGFVIKVGKAGGLAAHSIGFLPVISTDG